MPQPVPPRVKVDSFGSVEKFGPIRMTGSATLLRFDAADVKVDSVRRSGSHETSDVARFSEVSRLSRGGSQAEVLRVPAATEERNVARHELQRRIWHMSPGLLPFVMISVPHKDPLSFTTRAIAATLIIGIATLILLRQRTLARQGESNMGAAVLGYAVSTLALILAFPAHAELGLTLVAIMAFGDGTATLAGWLFGGKPLPWNRAKSWTGTCAFVAAALPLAAAAYWGEARPGVPFLVALGCVAPAVIAGALAESIRSRINDNIRVGIVSGLTIVATHAMVVGW